MPPGGDLLLLGVGDRPIAAGGATILDEASVSIQDEAGVDILDET